MIDETLLDVVKMEVFGEGRVYALRQVSGSGRPVADSCHPNSVRRRHVKLSLILTSEEVIQTLTLPERPSDHPVDMVGAAVSASCAGYANGVLEYRDGIKGRLLAFLANEPRPSSLRVGPEFFSEDVVATLAMPVRLRKFHGDEDIQGAPLRVSETFGMEERKSTFGTEASALAQPFH